MSGLCSIQKTAKAKRRSPGRLPTFRPGLLFLRRHGNAPRRAASRTPPRRGRRASKKVALREHHPRHDPHQHDHDGRNPRDNRPSPPAFFQLAQLALQIHPPSGERVR